ncbi:thiol:disulfide interchange protein [Solitalea canadensis DSM 3403]|uniref:Thiol:disulfide interchange protein n=2 Tax=Solitalea canadensis TaxID=995 RepID=H8KV53_SOLCM|nr:thiol:disulfide interchange protein [Solitalea canadensis DSM 3403]
MKKFLFTLFTFLPFLSLAQGTNFISGDWDSILKKAKAENKIIFVDCYFEGCMPCKQMDLKVYPDKNVGDALNKDFISFKTDVFKEDIGKRLSRKYGVHGFPSFLFITPEGHLIDQSSGFIGTTKLIDYLKQILELNKAGKFKKYTPDLNTPYPAFYDNAYMKGIRKVSADTVNAYLSGQDLFSEQAFNIINNFVAPDKYGEWFITNKERLVNDFGQNPVRNYMISFMSQLSKKYATTNSDKEFEAKMAEVKSVFIGDEWDRFGKIFIDGYFKNSKNAKWYIATLEKSGLYDWIDKGKVVSEVLPLVKDDNTALTELKKWYNGHLEANAAQYDLYNAAVINLYLKNYKEANELFAKAKSAEKVWGITDNDLVALETAIEKKDTVTFKPAKTYKVKPMMLE